MHLGEILLKRQVISADQLRTAVDESSKRNEKLAHSLVRLGYASEEAICRALSEQLRVPYVDLTEQSIDLESLDKVPLKIVFEKKLIPISNGDNLTVAVSDPFDLNTVDELRLLLKRPIKQVLARPTEIDKAIKKFYGVGADEVDRMMSYKSGDVVVLQDGKPQGHDLEIAEDAALIKFVNQLMTEAVRERASDIHIEPFEEELRIRYRVDGVLHKVPLPSQVAQFQNAIVSRLKIMANLNIAEKRLPQDGRIKIKVLGHEIDVRVSVIPGIFGEGIVLRLLDQEQILLSMEDLGMPKDVFDAFNRIIREPDGMLLVTGPTGSGKTTTLYAALQKINNIEDKIITVEDPVEYRVPGIKQIQVNAKIGLTFANGLRSILRHDPDIVMVGEIRDHDTAEIAVQASLTGHLVFSTLHTNDAPSAVTRLIDMDIEPYLIASTVEGCLAQRLVRRVCPECKRERSRDKDELNARMIPADIKSYWEGVGCEACRKTGFRGRIGLYELLTVTDDLRDMIVAKESAAKLKRHVVQRGMKTLRERGWDHVRAGVTTPDEVLRITKDDRF